MRHALIVLFIFTLPAAGFAGLIYVPDDQATIQGAIDAAMDGDTIIVRPGTYEENIDFLGKSIRVKSEQGAETTVIDGGNPQAPIYGSVVTFESGEGSSSVLEGFTLTNGTGYYESEYDVRIGGGILCYTDSSPTIIHNIITDNVVYGIGGGIVCYVNSSPIIAYNAIKNNEATGPLGSGGAGICCWGNCSPLITNNLIADNIASNDGAGIYLYENSTPLIVNNVISGNQATSGVSWGGGICCYVDSPLTITNNLIVGNHSGHIGGGMALSWPVSTLSNNTITGNSAVNNGGGCFFQGATITIVDSILWGNSASEGAEIYGSGQSTITTRYSDVEGGESGVYLQSMAVLHWGPGMIDADPLFVEGPDGDSYLSHTVCSDPADSPCLDAGDPASAMLWGTTRRDCCCDAPVIDMGYHYPGMERLIVGPGPADQNPPMVRVFRPQQAAVHENEFSAYAPRRFGVNVACGDVDNDGFDEIITGAGPGSIYGPHVRGWNVTDGTAAALPGLSFLAYGTNRWGVNVASGNLDGDGADEIITGAGPGSVFGPHVRAWSYTGSTVNPVPGVSYFAYGTPRWGVNVSSGDIDGDGYDEIVTGAGPGAVYGPHVRGWNVDGGPAAAISNVSFLAYGTNKYGVNVSCGDVDGDGIDEIVTAPGPSAAFGAHIRGWNYDGSAVTAINGINFFAWPASECRYGATVYAGTDLNGDGRDELAVGAGPDPNGGTPVKVYLYDGSASTEWISFDSFPGLTHGANVVGGRM